MTYIIGIDPGPVVGACLLRLPAPGGDPNDWHAELAQITPNGLWALIAGWIEAYPVAAVAAEAYVVGHRSSRVNDPGASRMARQILGGLSVALGDTRRIERTAADVKPWATDARLKAAGLLVGGRSLIHAQDAARHALYCACRDYGARVPRIGRAA